MGSTVTRILLIEDNPGDVRIIERFLARTSLLRCEMEHADRVQKGLERIRKGDVDVVLLDMSLPDSEPENTFSAVYRHAWGIPIIVLTGIDDDEKALEAVRQGAQDYLVKHRIDRDHLVRSIRYAIERKRSQEALRESEERYSLAVRGANDGLWDWNLKINRIYLSPRWLKMLGLDQRDHSGSPDTWFERIHPDDREHVRAAIEQHLEGKTRLFRSEHRLCHKNGHFLWVLSRGVAVPDEKGQPQRMAGSLSDITDRRQIEERLQHDAFYDSLTGLPNRALFLDRLDVALKRAQRHSDYLFAVLFLDLDRFKNVNDSLGHLMGDRLLASVAQRLVPDLRRGDTVARLGGDEFALLLDDLESPDRASLVATRILDQFSIPFSLEGHEVFTSTSIGIALSASGYERPEDILRDADIAMYRAKREGKARYAIFDREMHARAVALLELENDLQRAVEREEFCLHYQPIIGLASGRIMGFEALVRWLHPRRGLVDPAGFIPVAEETGLIVRIGHFVMREACRQTVQWQRQFPQIGPLAVNVNLSGKEFMQDDLVERVISTLEQTGLPPSSLRLELTESIFMENSSPIPETLQRLRDLQVELHIDDFGTGYSSLNYLHTLPAQVLKIDRSFISQIRMESGQPEMVRAIIHLARDLGLDVAAEGLETADELTYLRELKCEFGQGYYFSKPLEFRAATGLLASNPRW